MKKLILLLALGMLICPTGMALADWTALDQGWYDNYPDIGSKPVAIDQIIFYITTPGLSFADPGVINVGYGVGFAGWTTTTTPTEVVATYTAGGPAPTSATWNYEFTGSAPIPTYTLVWDGYYGNKFVAGEIDSMVDGALAGLSYGGIYSYQTPYAGVPVPPTVLLLGSGLFSLGLLGRRKIFKA